MIIKYMDDLNDRCVYNGILNTESFHSEALHTEISKVFNLFLKLVSAISQFT
jgi:hypothetical protein